MKKLKGITRGLSDYKTKHVKVRCCYPQMMNETTRGLQFIRAFTIDNSFFAPT